MFELKHLGLCPTISYRHSIQNYFLANKFLHHYKLELYMAVKGNRSDWKKDKWIEVVLILLSILLLVVNELYLQRMGHYQLWAARTGFDQIQTLCSSSD